MRYESIKKHGEKWVRIRPALQVYNQSAVLENTVEDAWFMSQITEDSLQLQSRDTQHTKVIGLDHIHHYMEDPEGQRATGTAGTLVMNVQLLLHEGVLLTEPVAAPGTPLKEFVRARPRAGLLNAAAKMRARGGLERARLDFARSAEGVQGSDQAFAELPKAFEALRDELHGAGQPIDLVIKGGYAHSFLLGAAGWWVSFVWQRYANALDDSELTVTQWKGHPPWPGVIIWEPGHPVGSDKYTFGLAALNQPRWLHVRNAEQSFTTLDLAQDVLTRLLELPNDRR